MAMALKLLVFAFAADVVASEVPLSTQLADVFLDTITRLSETDNSFICVCLDWWPEDKCDYGWCPWGKAGILNVDLENPRLVAAIRALSSEAPVHLRIGGSLEDTITYQVNGDEDCHTYKLTNSTRLGYDLKGTCLPMSRWEAIHKLCDMAGCDLLFGVNALKGREFHSCSESPEYGHEIDCRNTRPTPACCLNFTGAWNGSNANDLFQYTVEHMGRYPPPFALEFGNELGGTHGGLAHLSVEDYARDFKAFSALVRKAWPEKTPKLIAADTAFDKDWASKFLDAISGDLDIFTHHQYFLGAGVDPAVASRLMRPDYLDKIKSFGETVKITLSAHAPHAKIWMGEAGGAYNSGRHLVTDAFISGFWYLDNMANLAQQGHQAFCRQTLLGGNYALLNTTTLTPNPDFYSALLWQRLMGPAVLNASVTGPPTFRAYAHCTRGSSSRVTVLAMNMAKDSSLAVRSLSEFDREEYHLSSRDLNSQEVRLNGKVLTAGANASIPDLPPRIVDKGTPLVLDPLTYAFIVLRDVNAPACGDMPWILF